ncbi:hypothetical protein CKA32_006371 [Geitlerinema sp. FC II]|nr:hypothetical protein CKA32_006371 [Geitlerinema sp. FC II]
MNCFDCTVTDIDRPPELTLILTSHLASQRLRKTGKLYGLLVRFS